MAPRRSLPSPLSPLTNLPLGSTTAAAADAGDGDDAALVGRPRVVRPRLWRLRTLLKPLVNRKDRIETAVES